MQNGAEVMLYADNRLQVSTWRVGVAGRFWSLDQVARIQARPTTSPGIVVGLFLAALLLGSLGWLAVCALVALARDPVNGGVMAVPGLATGGLAVWQLKKELRERQRISFWFVDGQERHLDFESPEPGETAARAVQHAGQLVLARRAAAEEAARAEAIRKQAEEAARYAELSRQGEWSRAKALLERVDVARGPAARRAILKQCLREVSLPEARTWFVQSAAEFEVRAAFEKAGRLKSPDAKRRVFQTTLDELLADEVPDELQAPQIQALRQAIASLGE